MGKARQKKRRTRAIQEVTGERAEALSGKEGVKRWMKMDEPAFREDIAALKRDLDRGEREGDERLVPGWTPLFERFRRERISSVFQEQERLRAGTSQEVLLLPSMDEAQATATMQTGLQLVSTCLDRTELFLFTASAFAMSAYLRVWDTRISEELLPRAPVWIEYDRPRRMREAMPELATSAFWFSNPFQVETLLLAVQRGSLPAAMRRQALPLDTVHQNQRWLLEVYAAEQGAIAVLQYDVPRATWDFALGHANVCPHRQCVAEPLEAGGGLLVACEGCRAALPIYTRVFVTSLLIKSGAFRASHPQAAGEELPAPQTKTPVGSEPGGRLVSLSPGNAAKASYKEDGVPRQPVPSHQLQDAAIPQTPSRPRAQHGYTIIEFDASVRPRPRPPSGARRKYWAQGRLVVDLAELNELDIEIDDQAVVEVDLTFSGITRELRSPFFRHKQGQVITVKDYTVAHVKMTYAAYKRRLSNRRITKVTALRFCGLSTSPG